MRKTVDQEMIRHLPQSRSQVGIAEKAGFLQGAVSKCINGKLTEKKMCGRKGFTSNIDDKKRQFKKLGKTSPAVD